MLQYLFENKVATQEQIARDIFDNGFIQAVSRRLIKLTKAKYVSIKSVIINQNPRKVYSLTYNGRNQSIEGVVEGGEKRE